MQVESHSVQLTELESDLNGIEMDKEQLESELEAFSNVLFEMQVGQIRPDQIRSGPDHNVRHNV